MLCGQGKYFVLLRFIELKADAKKNDHVERKRLQSIFRAKAKEDRESSEQTREGG